MQFFSYIIQQNMHLVFLQSLFFFLYNFYFSSKLKNTRLIIFSIIMSILFPFLYIWVNFYATIIVWIFLILFNWIGLKLHSYHSILYATIPIFLLIFSDYVLEILFLTIFSNINVTISIRVLASLSLSIILITLMKKLLIRISTDLNYDTFKRVLCAFLLFTVCIYYVLISMNRFLNEPSIHFHMHAFLLLFYSCLSIILCFVTLIIIRKQADLKIKHTEIEQHLVYTKQLEQNYIEIRNFKHDYKNILLSIEILIRDGDIENFKQYYKKHIAPTKQEIDTNFPYLSDLGLIKVPEIKNILFSKLLQAKSMGIEANFNCQKEIKNFHINSLVLIRILEILLDYAIEEIKNNNNTGNLTIACIQQEDTIQIIICSTCKDNLLPLHQMKQERDSIKRKKHGFSLSNLDLLLSPLKNVILSTQYKDGQFTQTIEISHLNPK